MFCALFNWYILWINFQHFLKHFCLFIFHSWSEISGDKWCFSSRLENMQYWVTCSIGVLTAGVLRNPSFRRYVFHGGKQEFQNTIFESQWNLFHFCSYRQSFLEFFSYLELRLMSMTIWGESWGGSTQFITCLNSPACQKRSFLTKWIRELPLQNIFMPVLVSLWIGHLSCLRLFLFK